MFKKKSVNFMVLLNFKKLGNKWFGIQYFNFAEFVGEFYKQMCSAVPVHSTLKAEYYVKGQSKASSRDFTPLSVEQKKLRKEEKEVICTDTTEAATEEDKKMVWAGEWRKKLRPKLQRLLKKKRWR